MPKKSAKALAAGIDELASDTARREAMGETARGWVTRSFTLDNMIAQVSATYDEAVAQYRGAS